MISAFGSLKNVVENAGVIYESAVPGILIKTDKYTFSPEKFADAIDVPDEDHTWVTKHFNQIVVLFRDKMAYGSIIALVKYFRDKHQNAQERIIAKIKGDIESKNPQFDRRTLSQLLIAAVYSDLKNLAIFLIEKCKVSLDTQEFGIIISPLMYAINYSSPETLKAVINAAIKLQPVDLYIPNNQDETPLAAAWKVDPAKAFVLLGLGLGLVKAEHREFPAKDKVETAQIRATGFNYEKYKTAEVVLTAINKNDGTKKWLYSLYAIMQAFSDDSLDIPREGIARMLNKTNAELLAPGVLKAFMPLPQLTTATAEITDAGDYELIIEDASTINTDGIDNSGNQPSTKCTIS